MVIRLEPDVVRRQMRVLEDLGLDRGTVARAFGVGARDVDREVDVVLNELVGGRRGLSEEAGLLIILQEPQQKQ